MQVQETYEGMKVEERDGALQGVPSEASCEETNNLKTFANSIKSSYLLSFP